MSDFIYIILLSHQSTTPTNSPKLLWCHIVHQYNLHVWNFCTEKHFAVQIMVRLKCIDGFKTMKQFFLINQSWCIKVPAMQFILPLPLFWVWTFNRILRNELALEINCSPNFLALPSLQMWKRLPKPWRLRRSRTRTETPKTRKMTMKTWVWTENSQH